MATEDITMSIACPPQLLSRQQAKVCKLMVHVRETYYVADWLHDVSRRENYNQVYSILGCFQYKSPSISYALSALKFDFPPSFCSIIAHFSNDF